MGALGYEHAKCCGAGGAAVLSTSSGHPRKDSLGTGSSQQEASGDPARAHSESPHCKPHPPRLLLVVLTALHVFPIARHIPPSHPTVQSETWPPVPGLMWGCEQSGLSLIYDVRRKKTVQGGLQGLLSIPSPTSGLPPLAAKMGLALDGLWRFVHTCEKGQEGVCQLNCSVRISAWSNPLKNFKTLLNFFIFFFHN